MDILTELKEKARILRNMTSSCPSWTKDGVTITIEDLEPHLSSVVNVPLLVIKDLCIHKDTTDENILKRIDEVDLNHPIILLEHKGEFIKILDGNHRVMKAMKDPTVETVKARVLAGAPFSIVTFFI